MNCLIENEYIKGKTREQKKREKNSGKKNKKKKPEKNTEKPEKMEKTEKTTEKNGKKVGVLYYGGGYSPHLGVGFLFLILHPVRPPVVPPPAQLTHTHNLLTHSLLTHNLLTHNLLTQNLHTQLAHIQLAHTQLAHTACSHTTCSHTTCPHRTCTHTHTHHLFTHSGRRGAWRHSSSFHVAGVALGDIHLRFTWKAWHLETFIFVSRGRRGTWWRPPSFHVAGVVLDLLTHNLFTHNLLTRNLLTHNLRTSTYSRRRGTWRDGSSLFVAGVARMALGWLWWRARFPRARVVAAAFCVAGVALGDIHLRFTWQAWHLVTSTFVSRGRRGTRLTHFAWQAWHVWHWASSGGALGSHVPEWSPRLFVWQAWHLETFIFVSRGRRGTWWRPPSFHVAGVVLDLLTHNLFTHNLLTRNLLTHNLRTYNLLTQAWHLARWIVTFRGRCGTYGTGLALVARSVPTCPSGRRGFLRGRRGTWRHSSSFHVAGVALGDIHLRFTWQAWYSTYSLCVAGVARMTLG